MTTLKQNWREKFIWVRGGLVKLIHEEPVSPAGNSFMAVFGSVCFIFLIIALILIIFYGR